MADRRYSGRSWPPATRGDPPGRRLGAVAGGVAAVFALAAVVLVVLTAVMGSTVETTAYSAVAALLFGVLAISAVPRATPGLITSHELPLEEAPRAYDQFDKRTDGWTKVLLHPQAA